MQFKAVLSQDVTKDIINAIKHVSEEVRINVLPTGIRIQAVDPANVCMVDLSAKAESFEYFKAEKGEIALDMVSLEKFSSGKDSVSLELDQETHKFKVVVGKAKYTMSLIDPTAIKENPKVPELDMPAVVVMSGSDLREATLAASKVSDHVILTQDEENFTFSAKGDIDSFNMAFPLIELTGVKQGESRSLFSLDYLDSISKVAAKAQEVHISTGIDYPAIVAFVIGNITIRYLMAPRIEQD